MSKKMFSAPPSAAALMELGYDSIAGDYLSFPEGRHGGDPDTRDTTDRTKRKTFLAASQGNVTYFQNMLDEYRRTGRLPPSRRIYETKTSGGIRALDIPAEFTRLCCLWLRTRIRPLIEEDLAGSCISPVDRGSIRSYSRLKRSAATDLDYFAAAIHRAANEGYFIDLTLDLKDAFGNVPHEAIEEGLRNAGVSEEDISNSIGLARIHSIDKRGTVHRKHHRGIEQGNPLSVLLMSVALAGVLERVRQTLDVKIFVFVDDVYIAAKNFETAHESYLLFKQCAEEVGFCGIRPLEEFVPERIDIKNSEESKNDSCKKLMKSDVGSGTEDLENSVTPDHKLVPIQCIATDPKKPGEENVSVGCAPSTKKENVFQKGLLLDPKTCGVSDLATRFKKPAKTGGEKNSRIYDLQKTSVPVLQTFLVSKTEIGLNDEKLAKLREKLLAAAIPGNFFFRTVRKLAGAHALTKRWMKRNGLVQSCPITFSSEEVGMIPGESVETIMGFTGDPRINTCSGTMPGKPGMNTPEPAVPAGRAIPNVPIGSHRGNEDLTTGVHGNGNHIHYGYCCCNSPADSGNPVGGGGEKGVVANFSKGGGNSTEGGGNPDLLPGTTGACRGTIRTLGGRHKKSSPAEKFFSIPGTEEVFLGSSLKGKVLDLSQIGRHLGADVDEREFCRAIQKLLKAARTDLRVSVLVDPRDRYTAIAGILGNADDKQYKVIAEEPLGKHLLLELVLRRLRKRRRGPRTPPPVHVDTVLSWTRPSKRKLLEHEVGYTRRGRRRKLTVQVSCTNPMLARTEAMLRFVVQQQVATAVPATKRIEQLVLDPGIHTRRPELTYWLSMLRRDFTCERDSSWLVFRPKQIGTEAL